MTDSVYTVTPPDLRVTESGPSILMLGVAFDDSDPYIDLFDKLFPDSDVTFYTSESGPSEDNLAWYRATSSISSSIIVDIDNIAPEELLLALQAEFEGKSLVFWISPKQKNPKLQKLLNSYQYAIFSNINEIGSFLEAEYSEKNG
jgi:hypothetical protein